MFDFKNLKELADAVKDIQVTLNKIKIKIDVKCIKENMNNQLVVIKKMSKLGFVIPTNVDLSMQKKIFTYTNENELEKLFTEFFLNNNQKELLRINGEFNSYSELENFKNPYNEACFNFTNEKYFSSCLILTALLEGLIRNYLNIPTKDNNISGYLNGNLNKKYKDKYTILFQDKTGISKFIENYYLSIDANKINSQNYFNRNVLMHGLEFQRFRKIDAIKLFNIIDILNNLLLVRNYEVI